jgi:hypothetical protein
MITGELSRPRPMSAQIAVRRHSGEFSPLVCLHNVSFGVGNTKVALLFSGYGGLLPLGLEGFSTCGERETKMQRPCRRQKM